MYLSKQFSIISDDGKKKEKKRKRRRPLFCSVQMFYSCSLAPPLPRVDVLVAFTLGFERGFTC